jgi:DNA repair photolyase
LPALDGEMLRALEPHSAKPADRLETIADLKARGVPVIAAVEPLLPGLTDTRDRLKGLLHRLADAGVEQITAGYLVLRPGVRERLQEAMQPAGWPEVVLGAYMDGPMLRDGRRMSQFLHKSKRQRGYATLMALAAEVGIAVRLDGLSNPDFRPPRRPESAHHLRSLQQSFRDAIQPVRSSNAASA